MNLQDLTDRLESLIADGHAHRTMTHGGLPIVGIASYRGYYEQLMLQMSEAADPRPWRVDMLQIEAKRFLAGKVYQGYKGGDYTARPSTPIWVDLYGSAHGWAVSAISSPQPHPEPLLVESIDISDYA